MKKYVLGISSNGTDSSACLFKDGELLCAVEEERFTRLRHEGKFPRNAIKWCLKFAGIEPNEINHVGISWDYPRYGLEINHGHSIHDFYRSLEKKGYRINWGAVKKHVGKFDLDGILTALRGEFPGLPPSQIHFYCHHDCHAASAYCFSGFERSMVMIMDEKGEDICTSFYIAEGNYLQPLERFKLPHSLGLYYAAATQFLDLIPYRDEGTFMALAGTGKSHSKLKSWLLENVLSYKNDEILLKPGMISKEVFDYPRNKECLYTIQMINELKKFGIWSPEKTGIFLPRHRDFAYTIQEIVESVVLSFLNKKSKAYQVKHLCIAGGVGLNCKLNGRISENKSFELFVPPWVNDAGGAIGAAVLTSGNKEGDDAKLKVPRFARLKRADWGPGYPDNVIEEVLKKKKTSYYRSSDIVMETARSIADGKIVAWFQGRLEFGPRALGQRSLLSDPRLMNNKNRLQDIKRRLPFRPFAPSILEEHAGGYFNQCGEDSSFMTTAFAATEKAIQEIPASLNTADNTLRPQTVQKREGWLYRELIEKFHDLTGIPALLNTSFNIKEPLVMSPEHAISTFWGSNIDLLSIGNFIVQNRGV